MTDDDRLLLNQLRSNVEWLFQEFKEMETANKKLMDKVSALNQEILSIEKEKAGLSRENEKLKLANRILSKSDENMEAGKKINKIVREIDKCIALLNK